MKESRRAQCMKRAKFINVLNVQKNVRRKFIKMRGKMSRNVALLFNAITCVTHFSQDSAFFRLLLQEIKM